MVEPVGLEPTAGECRVPRAANLLAPLFAFRRAGCLNSIITSPPGAFYVIALRALGPPHCAFPSYLFHNNYTLSRFAVR